MVSLADLSGKLGQFIGQSDAVTKAINDAITAIINSHDEFKSLRNSPSSPAQSSGSVPAELINVAELLQKIQHFKKEIASLEKRKSDQNPSLSSEDSRLLSSHQSKLQSLQRLKSLNESFESLSNNNDNCKNLLESLCGGLEKFLGLKDGNYTGEGIVYSDLDRLADGVMSFLHGVLESVKDDDNVTKYDNYLNTNEKLNDVLQHLHSSIGQGRSVFGPQVTAVSDWLGRYEGEVNKKCEEFKKPITILKEEMKKHHDKIQEEKEFNELSYLVKEWTHRAQWYIDRAKDAENALKNIDPALSGKLTSHIKMLLQATGTFKEAAGNDDLKEMFMYAGAKMSAVVEFVDVNFREKSAWLQQYLRKNLGDLLKKLEDLRTGKFKTLADSVNKDLLGAFSKVKQGINGLVPKYRTDVVDKVRDIKNASDDFNKKFPVTRNALEKTITEVETQLGNFAKLARVSNAAGLAVTAPFLTAIGNDDDDDEPFQGLTTYFVLLDQQVMQHVKDAMDGIGNVLKNLVPFSQGNAYVKAEGQNIKKANTALQKLKEMTVSLDGFKIGDQDIEVKFVELNHLKMESEIGEIKAAVDEFDRDAYKVILPFKTIYPKLVAFTKDVSEHSQQVVEKLMEKIESQVKMEIKAVAGAIEAMVTQIKKGVNHDTDDRDVDYGNYGGGSQTAAGLAKLVNTFKADIDGALATLEESVGKEDQTKDGDSIYSNLKQLSEDVQRLGQSVADVRDKVKSVGNQLSVCIAQAERLITAAPQRTASVFTQLRSDVNSKINSAFTALQTQAKSLYTDRKTKEVTALQKIVDEQFKEIEKIINADKILGLKGYLNKLKEKFMPSVNEFAQSLSSPPEPQEKKKLADLAPKVKEGFENFFKDLQGQGDLTILSLRFAKLSEKFNALLSPLTHYNHAFTNNLETLKNEVYSLCQLILANNAQKVSLSLRQGLDKFTEELTKAYVNVYDGGYRINWSDETETIYGAKIFCTISPIWLDDLTRLRRKCRPGGLWKEKLINTSIEDANHNGVNPLGAFLHKCGYIVSREKQDGELRNNNECKGEHIYELLRRDSSYLVRSHDEQNDASSASLRGILRTLCDYIKHYYEACHLPTITSPKYPASVHQMLTWLTGLPHNPVYDSLALDGFGALFEKPDKGAESNDAADPLVLETDDDILPAYPQDITANSLRSILSEVCYYAEETLIAILGHGHSGGMYACDYNTNSAKLTYPSDASQCLYLLVEIVNRVFHQLCFLQNQCTYESDISGWADCWYGKHVGGSNWRCNDLQCPRQMADQRGDQTCNQKCNHQPNCGIKSPLQSFLEDGLPGFLPHPFDKPDCKMTCSLANHRGIPCKTPMGFGDISVAASHTEKGERLYAVLDDFCGDADKPLSKLCGSLACLLTTPPKTLGDMFSFYHQFLNGWNGSGIHRRGAFEQAVTRANFEAQGTDLDVTPIFQSRDHTGNSTTHANGDLFILVSCNGGSATLDPIGTCGPYLKPLNDDTRGMFSEKHADKYLSWIVYLTETFYDLLYKLLEDCKKKCGSPASRCNRETCVKDCRAVITSTKSPSSNHETLCKSIVQCNAALPNLYKYGFYYGSSTDLNGTYGDENKRTCQDFCKALDRVLNKEKHLERALAKLIYVTIPDFLWAIRTPFSYLLLALWSLSLLYLLHIAVVRLDVLRIRSHLRSPSSHRIAAQSLLAAARVKALANVKYFSP
ncbi:hypothetical protein, conserved [Babesia ovata]|uniref:Uncharacterized protein n=1 Tax=Babesia ovata TaxID=189622 RepID=A0A2H6KIU9_9APIC|nr:uncharacterized protein BOVATA_044160 [Babesia ovata]GBE62923.1 hypothetical protein, conserved [Babesia ovata]